MLLYRAVACPYFYPLARFESNPWAVPPRLPLGDAYAGECRAPGAAVPDENRMREICNLGYGRNRCEWFPAASAADAVRFHISEDTGTLVRIQYVLEKDCWPGESGFIESRAGSDFDAASGETLRRQAGAFLESYLRRRNER
ncbi:MAG TPA: hypothetical protein VMH80_11965 [Bryobacteraceae bacterium]|nr:hypothetical protein [Bryobacteraceae bacterium]